MAPVPFFNNDLEILNYALTLEHLEANFYVQVVDSNVLIGEEQQTFIVIRDHEVAHVETLTQAIQGAGGTPVKARQSYDFSSLGDMNTRAGILQISAVLEATGVGAYDGAAFEFKNKAYLAVAGQIVQVEARHTAAIREIDERTADNPVPLAFEQTLRPQQVLDAVTPLMSAN